MIRFAAVLAITLSAFLASEAPASAQGLPSWADEAFGRAGNSTPRRWQGMKGSGFDMERPPQPPLGGDVRDGGPRPDITPASPPVVAFTYDFPPNSIVIDTGARKLYFVRGDKTAYEYAVAVGREGFNWAGTETVSRKQPWPDWHPPAEMRERDPRLPEKMTGGARNPLGAVALYLGNTLYRIHGTNDAKSIGRAESSGCFRMMNADVLHLASITEIGTSVTVVPSLPPPQVVSQLPERPAQPTAASSQPVARPDAK